MGRVISALAAGRIQAGQADLSRESWPAQAGPNICSGMSTLRETWF